MPDAPIHYYPEILSYDEKRLVYIAMSFAEDSDLTDEQWLNIARSIQLESVE